MIKPELDVDLRKLSSLRIGGRAERVYFPTSLKELAELARALKMEEQSFHLIGKGSNIVFSAEPLSTPIICTVKMKHRKLIEKGSSTPYPFEEIATLESSRSHQDFGTFLFTECGALNSDLIRLTVSAGVGDITVLTGVPGTFGGALAMNAEGIMNEMEGNMWLAELSGEDFSIKVKASKEYHYEYRYSSVQETLVGACLLRLFKKDPAVMRKSIRKLLERRKATQPLEMPSPGSVFKNPPGDYAGRLLEAAGMKGVRIGDVAYSQKHANFIVNLGDGKGADVLSLMALGKKTVWEKFGIWLLPEVKFIGQFDEEALHFVTEVGKDEKK